MTNRTFFHLLMMAFQGASAGIMAAIIIALPNRTTGQHVIDWSLMVLTLLFMVNHARMAINGRKEKTN